MFDRTKDDFEIVSQITSNQKEQIGGRIGGMMRKNNRKVTRGRNTQYVTVYDDSIWPIKSYTRCIKHLR